MPKSNGESCGFAFLRDSSGMKPAASRRTPMLRSVRPSSLFLSALPSWARSIKSTSLWPRKVRGKKPQPAGHALIQDHHEGYISWEMFETNQRRIASNYSGKTNPGAPREGESLLQGLVLCGVCGRRVKGRYVNKR